MSDVPEELIELAGEICSQIAEFGAPAQETVARALMAERERCADVALRKMHNARVAAAIRRGTA